MEVPTTASQQSCFEERLQGGDAVSQSAIHSSTSCSTTSTRTSTISTQWNRDHNCMEMPIVIKFHAHPPLRYVLLLVLLTFGSFCGRADGCGPGRGIGGPRRYRKLTPLVYKEHVPNTSEKALGASGTGEGPIRQDSPRFNKLVPNYNKDIIFKDEEGTGEDIMMTNRCKDKLNTLAISVMNQWPGVKLRVTESWDKDHLHGEDSLHYEGRAVDITTSDRDNSKYGMLARLAVEAGFDWVYYQSRAHIHCSVKADSKMTTHMSGCFTPESTVLTASGERKAMSKLAIGDRVLSMSNSGTPIYSEVILFMDRNLEQMEEFVEMRTEDNAILTVTAAHLVFVWNPRKQLLGYVFADRVEENDYVLVHDDKQNHLRPQRVIELKAVLRKGVIAPLTSEGTIVVNSIAASCYAVVNSQRLAHWSLAPMRLIATISDWLPSSKSSYISETKKISDSTAMTQQTNGIHWYAKALYKLKDYVVPHSWTYHI